jgi:D-lactate dehydrogenase (cytochrome)
MRETVLMEAVTQLLATALAGDASRVRDGDSERDLHSEDMSLHTPHRPDVVVYPISTAEISAVLAIASEHDVPVTPFGAGSSLEGHVIPQSGGISLDLTRMDRIVEMRPDDLQAVVEPGVTRSALGRAAGQHGLWFPVDPGADATLGGMAATNAAGTTTLRYGKMRSQVLALEAVLADGSIIRTGSAAAKTSAGYDLTGLLVGSEGTLAVITELTLRLQGIAERTVAARLTFADLETACRVATAAVASGQAIHRLELLDAWTVERVNAFQGASFPAAPSLFVEAAGQASAVDEELGFVLEIARGEGAIDIVVVEDADDRATLWKARHDVAYATSAAAPGRKHRTTDTCVPLSQLAGHAAFARTALDEAGVVGGIIGHAGDGNLHVGLMVDPGDTAEIAVAIELADRLVQDALSRGGTATGEHGIGIGKLHALELEHPDLLGLYRGIKSLFDPHGIMNPGKVVGP